jgi:hypothetical protein
MKQNVVLAGRGILFAMANDVMILAPPAVINELAEVLVPLYNSVHPDALDVPLYLMCIPRHRCSSAWTVILILMDPSAASTPPLVLVLEPCIYAGHSHVNITC